MAIKIQYRTVLIEPVVNNSISLAAYAVNADGVYTDVTAATTWTSSNALVIRSFSNGNFSAVGAGTADANATYQGLRGSVTIPVKAANSATLPNLTVSPASSFPFLLSVGDKVAPAAYFNFGAGNQTDVSASATWTSSDPEVASFTGNRLSANSPGNTEITVSYNGLSTWYRVSVPPRSH